MTTVAYPLRVPKKLMELAKLRSKEEYVDNATALRQLIYLGAEDYVMELYEKGRISLSMAADLLDRNVHDIIRLAQMRGIRAGASEEQQSSSEKTSKELD
jgi:predicted HTH domain antitoxin